MIYVQPEQHAEAKQEPLSNAISKIEGWNLIGQIPLDENVIKSLHLDDSAFMNFFKRENIISLYIGYYLTSKKLDAAHNPLVCFPGQGWKVSEIQEKKMMLKSDRSTTFRYALMTAEKNQQKELILYWFQSYDTTSSSTFFQKISAFKNRMEAKNGDNTFVRVSLSLSSLPADRAESIALDFIQAFYPVFIKYIEG